MADHNLVRVAISLTSLNGSLAKIMEPRTSHPAAAAEQGATAAGYVLLRLPDTVQPIFLDWLRQWMPDRAQAVENCLRDMRGRKLYDAQFGQRMRGTGPFAAQIQATFQVFARRCGLAGPAPDLNIHDFRPPVAPGEQRRLF